jgi:hypothetical protein
VSGRQVETSLVIATKRPQAWRLSDGKAASYPSVVAQAIRTDALAFLAVPICRVTGGQSGA